MIARCIQLILKLFPPGPAWTHTPGSKLYNLAEALAEELFRVENRGMELIAESDPRTTTELLEDWERVLGLPGDCVGLAETLAARRAAVVSKLISRTAQTKAYYISLASTLGYTITENEIIETPPHTFSLILPADTTRSFRVNQNRVGDHLREWGDELLECVIEDNKPAHSVVLFQYV
jgi:uncharacterized protein YmfQ (DUF2313 family)